MAPRPAPGNGLSTRMHSLVRSAPSRPPSSRVPVRDSSLPSQWSAFPPPQAACDATIGPLEVGPSPKGRSDISASPSGPSEDARLFGLNLSLWAQTRHATIADVNSCCRMLGGRSSISGNLMRENLPI